jgi:hypothetical protein
MGFGAAFAAGFPGFRRYEAETGLGQAVAISFGSLTSKITQKPRHISPFYSI